MRVLKLFVLSLFLFSATTEACMCLGNCLKADYDLAAKIEILSVSNSYSGAFDARVIDMMGWNEKIAIKDGQLYNLITRKSDKLVVVIGGVHPLGTNSRTSCSRNYKVGQKLLFFANEVKPGFYRSDQCSCTKAISN